VLVLVAALMMLVVGGCGGDDDSSADDTATGTGDTSGGEATLSISQLLYGPEDDGGFNLSNTAPAAALQEEFGDQVAITYIDQVPFSEEAAQLAQRQIDEGANVLIDTVGLADIFYAVCEDNPDVDCIAYAATGDLPDNVQGVWSEYWLKEYAAGQLAGRLTESNTVGFVSPLDAPFIRTIINSFAMGCRDANPDCEVRVVTVNEYFNPPKSSQAANTLVDAGADVLRGGIDDPSYCAVAEQRGVWAIPEFWDGTPQCPQHIATSTVWNWSPYMVATAQQMLDGTYERSSELHLVPTDEMYTLGPWGPNVPEDVKTETEASFDALMSGAEDPFVGPISDSKGEVRIEDGERPDTDFFMSGWDWYVEGVVAD
jgi:basic membrane lipoprotein Med (substrate-binding protein (PBP1-ABC) superfamily)